MAEAPNQLRFNKNIEPQHIIIIMRRSSTNIY
jgi:hypothetical protein